MYLDIFNFNVVVLNNSIYKYGKNQCFLFPFDTFTSTFFVQVFFVRVFIRVECTNPPSPGKLVSGTPFSSSRHTHRRTCSSSTHRVPRCHHCFPFLSLPLPHPLNLNSFLFWYLHPSFFAVTGATNNVDKKVQTVIENLMMDGIR